MEHESRTNESILPQEVRQASKSPENLVGSHILIERVGHGGSGEVYRAWDIRVGRFVALKFLLDINSLRLERFEREAKMVARLSHPNIIPLLEFSSVNGRPFMTMPLITGATLADVRLPTNKALEVMADVADAVQYAHEQGVIHRDLKPSNLMLDDGGHPWVMDFGIARILAGGDTLTMAGDIVGTLEYMPPEQAKAGRCDERSDVYSLGASLYHMLSGRPPFSGESPFEVIYQLMRFDPPSLRQAVPATSLDVESIIGKAMAKEPKLRYKTARAFADDIRRHLAGRPIAAKPVGFATRVIKWTRRHRTLASLGMAATLGVLMLAFGAVLYAVNINRASKLTQLRLAQALVSEGDALGAGLRWASARERYEEAKSIFGKLGADDSAAVLGTVDADRSAGPPIWRIKGHSARIRGVEILRGADVALSTSDDGALFAWNLRTGVKLASLCNSGSRRYFVVGNALSTLIVSGTAAGALEQWRFDGKAFAGPETLLKLAVPVRAAVFSPDGKTLAVGDETGTLHLLNVASHEVVWTRHLCPGPLRALTFSPDGLFVVAAGGDNSIRVLSAESGELKTQVTETEDSFSMSLQFLGTDHRFVSSTYLGVITEWSWPDLKPLVVMRGHVHSVPKVHIEPATQRLVSASFDGSILRWKRDGSLDETLAVERGMLMDTATDASGKLLFAGDNEGDLYLFRSGDESSSWFWGRVPEGIYAAQFSPDGRMLVTQGPADEVGLWDRSTGAQLSSVHLDVPPYTYLVPMPMGRARTMEQQSILSVWDLTSGVRKFSFRFSQALARVLALTPDGRYLVGADFEGTLKMTDANTGELVWALGDAGVKQAWAVTLSDDGKRMLVTGSQGQLAMWSLADKRILWKQTLGQGLPVLTTASFEHAGHNVYVGGNNQEIFEIDVQTGRVHKHFEGHRGEVINVKVGAPGRLLSYANDGVVRLWDTVTGKTLHAFTKVRSNLERPYFAFSEAGDAVLIKGAANFIHIGSIGQLEPTRCPDLSSPPSTAAKRLLDVSRSYGRRHLWTWAWDALVEAKQAGAVVCAEESLQVAWRSNHLIEAGAALADLRKDSQSDTQRISLLERALQGLVKSSSGTVNTP